MEIFGKKHQLATFIVFLGVLLSSSNIIYQPLTQTYLNFSFPYLWIFTSGIILTLFVYSFYKYLHSDHCSFMLQVGEYIFLPITGFTLIQHLSYNYKDKNLPFFAPHNVLAIIYLQITALLVLLKILYLNQIFPGETNKNILNCSNLSRMIRLIKILINCIAFFILNFSNLQILHVFLNLAEFLVINARITFINPEIQQFYAFASCNNIVSIIIFILPISNPLPWHIISLLFFTGIYILIDHPIQHIMQLKYSLYFKRFASQKKGNITKKSSNQTIILLVQLYSNIFKFQGAKLIMRSQAKFIYSQNFLFTLNKTYEMALFCLLFTSEKFKKYFNSNESNKPKQTPDIHLPLNFASVGQTSTKLNISQILEDKLIFLNFIAFCMDNFQQQQILHNQIWNASTEFFLTFTSNFSTNFVMKNLITYQINLIRCKQSIFGRARNRKFYAYLRQHKLYHEMNTNSKEEYIMFQELLNEIKTNMLDSCHQQVRLLERLLNPLIKKFECEDNLFQRNKIKKATLKALQKGIQHPYCEHFDEFTFLFLLYSTIFCKATNEAEKKIRYKIVAAKKREKCQKTLDIITKPMMVCSGLNTNKLKMGEIVLSNYFFRETFEFSRNPKKSIKNRICDLFVFNQQKDNHLNLMMEGSQFSENAVKQFQHSDYDCFLKVNLQSLNFDLFKRFSVSTSVLQCYQNSLMYLCCFEEKGSYFYMLESEYQNLQFKEPTRKEEFRIYAQKIAHSQLGVQMPLVQMAQNQLFEIGVVSKSFIEIQETHYSRQTCYGSYKTPERLPDQDELKFAKIEEILWNDEAIPDKKLLKNLFISLVALLIGIACCVASFYFSTSKSASAVASVNDFSTMMSTTQGCEMRFALVLYLIRKMDTGAINPNICASFDIDDLNQYLRSKSHQCISHRINGYFTNYYEKKKESVPVFDPNFIQPLGIESDTIVDYSNYIYEISSSVSQYMQQDLSTISDKKLAQLNNFIRDHSKVDQSSFSYKFVKLVCNNVNQLLKNIKLQHQTIMIIVICIAVASFTVFLKYSFMMFRQKVKFYQLLNQITFSALNQRVDEVKYIIKEIDKIYDSYLNKYPDIDVKIGNPPKRKKYNKIKTQASEFQKSTQNNSLNIKEIDEQMHCQNALSIKNVLLFKKHIFLSAFLLCVGMLCMMSAIDMVSTEIIQNSIFDNLILGQAAITKETFVSINFAIWIAYFKQDQLRSKEQNKEYLQLSNNYVKSKKFFNLLYQNLDLKLLNESVYVDVCSLISHYTPNAIPYEKCVSQLADMSKYSTAQLLSIISQRQYDVWDKIYGNQTTQSMNQMCRNLLVTSNELVPAIISTWTAVISSSNELYYILIDRLQIILYIFVIVQFLIIASVYSKVYYKMSQVIEREILMMDQPRKLYQFQPFKPYFNAMIYRSS